MKYVQNLIFTVLMVFLFNLATCPSSFAQQETIDTLKKLAFTDIIQSIDLNNQKAIDPNYFENKRAITLKRKYIANREIMSYSDGYYLVIIWDKAHFDKTCVYDSKGHLQEIHVFSYPFEIFDLLHKQGIEKVRKVISTNIGFPICEYEYSYPDGKLFEVAIHLSNYNSYCYNPAGELNGHWVNNKLYNMNGNRIMTGQ